MARHALVAYATKHGGTIEIAVRIGETLRACGLDVDVRSVGDVTDLRGYDLVVLGSAVYMFRWQGEALDFARRFEPELREGPTWFFSSGPTGGTPKADAQVAEQLERQGPPPGKAGAFATRIGIRGHRTFGGHVGDGMGGFFERWVPKGDWRDFEDVTAWAQLIAADPVLSKNAVPHRHDGSQSTTPAR